MIIKNLFNRIFGTQPKFMVRASDPITSIEAAEQVDSMKLESMVYEVLAKHPSGLISDEIMTHFPNHGIQTISPRYAPLIRKGFIEDSGEKRLAKSGKYQRVLRVVK
jgi:hypothetical protein